MALLGTHKAIPPPVTGSSQVETTLGLECKIAGLFAKTKSTAQRCFILQRVERQQAAHSSLLSSLLATFKALHAHQALPHSLPHDLTARSWHKVPHAAEARGCRNIRPMSTLRNTFSTLTLSHTQILPVVILTISQTVFLILFPTNQPTHHGTCFMGGQAPFVETKRILKPDMPPAWF